MECAPFFRRLAKMQACCCPFLNVLGVPTCTLRDWDLKRFIMVGRVLSRWQWRYF